MKRLLLASLVFTLSAVQAAGPQFATPPMPAGVRAVPNYMTPQMRVAPVVPTISVAPSALPVVKAAPAPGSGSLGPPLPRSFSGTSALAVTPISGLEAPVPTIPGSINLPVFPPSAGAILNYGPRQAQPGVFLDLSKKQ